MRLFYILIIFLFCQNCSFDNKSGIWKNDNIVRENDSDDFFQGFKKISSSSENFNKTLPLDKNFKFKVLQPFKNLEWKDIFYSNNNNFRNFKYSNLNQIVYKSKKLSKNVIDNFTIFEDGNLIFNDQKGNIIVFSISKNIIISKFNFYKKKFKGLNKKLNFIVEKNIIYVSDNIGYLYAYNYRTNKILWAKNYKIPFRSNLKLSKDKLFASNQNNDFYVFEKNSGNFLKLVPTEETVLKNQFVNNLLINENSLIFLNTYGSLYSMNIKTLKLNWFINLNKSSDINLNNIFFGNQIVSQNGKIVVSSNQYLYIIDQNSGSIISKKNFSSKIKPILSNNYLFLVSKNNLLISMDLNNGNIIYSYDISDKVAEYLNLKKKKIEIRNIMLVNSEIYIFLRNSYVIKFDIEGEINQVDKLPAKINSQPMFIDDYLMFLDNKNKFVFVN